METRGRITGAGLGQQLPKQLVLVNLFCVLEATAGPRALPGGLTGAADAQGSDRGAAVSSPWREHRWSCCQSPEGLFGSQVPWFPRPQLGTGSPQTRCAPALTFDGADAENL